MDISLANITEIVANTSLLVTVVSFFIYLAKKKRKRLTEERKDILQDVQNLILGIEKIPYNEKDNILGIMDAVQFLFGTRNKLNYESIDKDYVFGSLDKMIFANSEEEYIIQKEIVISFLYYFYENSKERFEKEKSFKKYEILFGICTPVLFTVIFMSIFGLLFSITNIYVLFGYGLCFWGLDVCIYMMGYCSVDDACDKKKKVVADKKGRRVVLTIFSAVSTLLLLLTDFFMVLFCVFVSSQGNESEFTVKLIICFIVKGVYLLVCAGYLCAIYNYRVQYVQGFETVTSRVFYEYGYDIDQLRELAKKIVSESDDESIYIKLFVSICDKHRWALYSEKRKLEKVMNSFEDAERLEKVIACIKETKKLKKELIELKKLFRTYRKKYIKFDDKLKERNRAFQKQIEKCNVE